MNALPLRERGALKSSFHTALAETIPLCQCSNRNSIYMLDEIEARLDLQFPKLYRQLHSDGMLDWGEPDPQWGERALPSLRAKPPLLIFADDFRLIAPRDIELYAARLDIAETTFHAIAPIGKNGAGELYCLLFSSRAQIDCVCKTNRWTGESIKLAKDLEDFLFRELLAAAVQINEADLDSEAQFCEDMLAMLGSHREYIGEDRSRLLAKIYSAPIRRWPDGELGMIGLDEFFEILNVRIPFSGLHQRFALPTPNLAVGSQPIP
jgi:hypothetical protein